MDSTDPISDPLLGTELGGCVIEHPIGVGATGSVYRARQISLDRQVAIKILHPHVALQEVIVTRFAREARAAARLRHPHLVQVYDFGQANDLYYYTMELVEGLSLGDALKEQRVFSEHECLNICRQAISALSAAHSSGIVHRDLKPDNMLLDTQGLLKISDLGLAQTFDAGAGFNSLTMTGDSLGTPYYMSPEQVQDARNVDYRTDYYSLGASLFHLATGAPPYEGDSRFTVMSRHVNDPVPFARDARPGLTVSFSYLISRLMAKNPDDRPSSPDEIFDLVDACERAAATGVDMQAPQGAEAESPAAPPRGGKLRGPVLAIAAGAILIAASAFLAVRWPALRSGAARAKLKGSAAASVMALQTLEKIMHAESLKPQFEPVQVSNLPVLSPRDFLASLVFPTSRLLPPPGPGLLPPVASHPRVDDPALVLAAIIDQLDPNRVPRPLSDREIASLRNSIRERVAGSLKANREYLRLYNRNPPLIEMQPPSQPMRWALSRGHVLRIRPTWPPYSKDIEQRLFAAANSPAAKATLELVFTEVTSPGRVQIDSEKVSGPGTLPPRTIASAPIQKGRAVVVALDVTSTFQYQVRRSTLEDFVLSYQGDGVAWLTPHPEFPPGAHAELEIAWPRNPEPGDPLRRPGLFR